MDETITITIRLDRCQAWITIYENGWETLLSYSTHVVAKSPENKIYLLPKWDCSVTTMKHVRKYINMYAKKTRDKISKGEIEVISTGEMWDLIRNG